MTIRCCLVLLNRLILLISLLFSISAYAEKPALQLATVYSGSLDLSRYWVSEKLDGVRGYWDGAQLLTRQGYPIDAPGWFTAPLPEQPLDGELWLGRGQFDKVSAIVRSGPADNQQLWDKQWRQVKYMLFDLPGSRGTFNKRLRVMERLVSEVDRDWIRLVPQQHVATDARLIMLLDQVVAAGGEGLMLHRGNSLYHKGRSADLLKLKRWLDAEARVIGHLPGKGKYVGKLGALLVETPTGLRFKLGSGFTDQQRENPPAIGSMITYKYTGLSAKGVPRFASFLRVRQP
ncbi:DNA ligase [Amphritea sp. HPY]|uniref:DNA ligase n=1 Tax=Amphritea sp. HPY TaxID=3421652 RepID=UPI003D7C9DEE